MRAISFNLLCCCAFIITLLCACKTGQTGSQASSQPDKFISLFNGTDLTGWDGNANWSVVDGAIQGNGGSGLGQSSIWTIKDYDNFRLIVTSRMVEVNKDHLGILFWGARPEKGNYKSKGFLQVQPPNGSMWDYVINKDPKPERPIPNPRLDYTQWSTIEILANISTGEVRVASNGIEVVYYKAADPSVWKSGPIGMQQHGKGIIQYKDIKIEVNPKENRLITVKQPGT